MKLSCSDAAYILNDLTISCMYKDMLALTGINKPQLLDRITISRLGVFMIYRLDTFSRNLRNEISTKKKIHFHRQR